VIAFEPNPVPRAILARNLKRNGIANVELHGSGLGDEEGELQLFVPHVNSGEGSFTRPSDDAAGDYVACPISVGDAVIGARCPRVIKIDVEGFEAHVLRGLAGTLARGRPLIVMEMIAGHLERDGQSPDQLCAWLAGLGYRGYRLGLRGRHELDITPMSTHWQDGDYAFVHRHSANSQEWQRSARRDFN
jgi:FkbM family methyltransferase